MCSNNVSIMDAIKTCHKMEKAFQSMRFDYSINPYLGYWYAEEQLYILKDFMVDAYYFVKANSPYDAVEKVLKRVDETMKAGQFLDEEDQE